MYVTFFRSNNNFRDRVDGRVGSPTVGSGGGGANSLQGPSDAGFADADSDATTDSATSGSKFDLPLSKQVSRINQSALHLISGLESSKISWTQLTFLG